MSKILEFSPKPPSKLGFERVRKKGKSAPTKQGQLNLFAHSAQVLKLPSDVGPFDAALILDERGDGRAQEAYLLAIQEGDCVADAYCNLGIIESQAGRPAKAFDCFTKSLEHNPRHVESHYNLGNLYFDEGNLRLARMHYELAAEIDPTFSSIHFNLGLVHAMERDFASARQALSRYKELAGADEGRKADPLIESIAQTLASTSKRT